MKTYFAIQCYRKGQWVILQFDNYDDGIGWYDEEYARAWLKLYSNRKWRLVKRIVNEETV